MRKTDSFRALYVLKYLWEYTVSNSVRMHSYGRNQF